jgi:hypothetical protein
MDGVCFFLQYSHDGGWAYVYYITRRGTLVLCWGAVALQGRKESWFGLGRRLRKLPPASGNSAVNRGIRGAREGQVDRTLERRRGENST